MHLLLWISYLMIIVVAPEHEAITVTIDGLLHLWVPTPRLLGIQSWVRSSKEFHIEYFMENGTTIDTAYDSYEKWKSILEQLRPILVGERSNAKRARNHRRT